MAAAGIFISNFDLPVDVMRIWGRVSLLQPYRIVITSENRVKCAYALADKSLVVKCSRLYSSPKTLYSL